MMTLRLTFLNALIIGFALLVVGWGTSFAAQKLILKEIDRDLAERVSRATSRSHAPPGPPGRPHALGPDGRPDNFAPPNPPDEPDLSQLDDESKQLLQLRRPRIGWSGIPARPTEAPWDAKLAEQSLQGERSIVTMTSPSGEPIRVISLPIERGHQTVGWVQAATELTSLQRLNHALSDILYRCSMAALFIASAAGFFLARQATAPIQKLTEAAEKVSISNLGEKIPSTRSDEIGDLTDAFNRMSGRLRIAFFEQQMLLNAQKQFAADASHELRTPLTRIKLIASAAAMESDIAPELRARFAKIDQTCDQMSELVEELIELARVESNDGQLEFQRTGLATIVRTAIETAGLQADSRLRIQSEDSPIECHRPSMERAVVNLLTNAARHTPPDGIIRVTIRKNTITVADNGSGIEPEHLPHVTKRFYRADESRSREAGGSGLGLSIVEQIVNAHGGKLSISSSPGEGTSVTINLPPATME